MRRIRPTGDRTGNATLVCALLALLLLLPGVSGLPGTGGPGVGAAWAAAPDAARQSRHPIKLWPLIYRNDNRLDILAGLVHTYREGSYARFAVRPFLFSSERDTARDFRKVNWLWPLGQYRSLGPVLHSRFLPFYWHDRSPHRVRTFAFPSLYLERKGDTRRFYLWPLFGSTRKGDGHVSRSILPPFFRYTADRTTGITRLDAPWPLVKFHSGPGFVKQRVFPLYGLHRTEHLYKGHLLNYYWSRAAERTTRGLWPLWHMHRSPELQTDLVLPLYYRRTAPDSQLRMITPLWMDKRKGEASYRHLLPVYFSRSTPTLKTTLLIPLYYSRWTPAGSFKAITPLFLMGESRRPGQEGRFTALFPLYLNFSGPNGHVRMITPLWLSRRDGDDRLRALVPFYFDRVENGLRSTLVLPFYLNHERPDGYTRMVTPFYYHGVRGDDRTRVVLPFLFHRVKDGLTTTLIPPVYLNHQRPDGYTRMVTPFYYDSVRGDDRTRAVFPFLFHWVKDGLTTTLIPPVYYFRERPDGHTRLIAPVYYSSRHGDDHTRMVLPFWFSRVKDGLTTTLIPPFYYNAEHPEGYTRLVTPFWFSRVRGEDYSRAVFPVYFEGKQGDRRNRTILPFYFSRQSPERGVRLILPFWLDVRSGEERTQVGMPLYFHHTDAESARTVVFPFFFRVADLVRDREFTYWFPLYGTYRHGDVVLRRFMLFPLYAKYFDAEFSVTGHDVLWPLFHYAKGPGILKVRALPLLWHSRTPERTFTAGFPLYWRLADKERDLRLLLPLYASFGRADGYRRRMVLGPVFVRTVDPSRDLSRTSILFPLISAEREGETSKRWIFPFYFHRSDPDSRLTLASAALLPPYYYHKREGDEAARGLFPFYHLKTRGDHYARLMVLGPLFTRTRDDEKDLRATSLLFGLFAARREGETRHQHLLPFYGIERRGDHYLRLWVLGPMYIHLRDDKAGTSRTLAALGLYLNEHDKDTHRFRLLPFYGFESRGSHYSRSWVLGPMYIRLRDDTRQLVRSTALFGLYLNEREGEWRRHRVLPFYSFEARGEEYAGLNILGAVYRSRRDTTLQLARWDALFGWFGSEHEGATSKRWLHPIYLDDRSPNERRLHILPFYRLHTRGASYVKKSYMADFYTSLKDDARGLTRTRVAWGLYGNDHEGETYRSWLIPFYYRWGDAAERNLVGALGIFPPYVVSKKTANSDLLHVWPFYGRKRKGSYVEHSTLWPLVRVGGDPQIGRSFAHVLLFYRDVRPERKLTSLVPFWMREVRDGRVRDVSPLLHWYEKDLGTGQRSLDLLWLVPGQLSLARYASGPDETRHGVFPLWGYRHDKRTGAVRWSALWPLFNYQDDGELGRQTEVLWKVFTYERSGPDSSELRLLWRLIYKKRTPAGSEFEFNPFVSWERGADGRFFWQILGGLIGNETRADGSHDMQLLWLF